MHSKSARRQKASLAVGALLDKVQLSELGALLHAVDIVSELMATLAKLASLELHVASLALDHLGAFEDAGLERAFVESYAHPVWLGRLILGHHGGGRMRVVLQLLQTFFHELGVHLYVLSSSYALRFTLGEIQGKLGKKVRS